MEYNYSHEYLVAGIREDPTDKALTNRLLLAILEEMRASREAQEASLEEAKEKEPTGLLNRLRHWGF